MSHNINEDRVMVVGEPAWHGIGRVLDKPATAAEAIEAAKLDYTVEKSVKPVYVKSASGAEIEIPGEYGIFRTDTKEGFKCVGNRYQIVQNRDAFSFFDSIVGEGQAIYHTAGALGRGEKVWILAKLPDDIIVKGVDIVEKNLTLVNTHDGSSPLQMFFSPVRVVCQNTLSAALGQKTNEVRIRHTGNILRKVDVARESLKLAVNYYNDFEQIIDRLASYNMNVEQAEGFFNGILFGEDEADDERTKLMSQRDKMLTLFERGMGNDMQKIRHTAWAALNSVTEFIDHHRAYKKQDQQPTKRLSEIWFGSGADLREKAFASIISIAGLN